MAQPLEHLVFSNGLFLADASGEHPVTRELTRVDDAAQTVGNDTHNDVDAVIERLRTLAPPSNLQGVLETGEVIFHTIFKGDKGALRSRGRKSHSFRSLAEHHSLPFSAASLWRAVAAYELSLRMPELRTFAHLGIGHVSVVLGLPFETQRSLLCAAESERWTRKRLVDASAKVRPQRRRRGRPPVPEPLKVLRGLSSLAEEPLPQDTDELSSRHKDEALDVLSRVRQRCSELEQMLAARSYSSND